MRTFIVAALSGVLLAATSTPAMAQVTLVAEGKSRAVVITAAHPSPVAAYAAAELIEHVKKATGQQLPLATETDIPPGYDYRVFVGACQAARSQGFDPDALEIESICLRTAGKDLYILGKELFPEQYHGSRPLYSEPWNPLAMECVHSGTLLGVYELLEDVVGVALALARRLGNVCPAASQCGHSFAR